MHEEHEKCRQHGKGVRGVDAVAPVWVNGVQHCQVAVLQPRGVVLVGWLEVGQAARLGGEDGLLAVQTLEHVVDGAVPAELHLCPTEDGLVLLSHRGGLGLARDHSVGGDLGRENQGKPHRSSAARTQTKAWVFLIQVAAR